MKLTLFSPDLFTSTLLPVKCAGQYWVCSKNTDGTPVRIIAVEGIRSLEDGVPDQWILKSNSNYQIIGDGGRMLSKVSLEPLTVYMIQSSNRQEEYRLYTEPLSEDRKTYLVYEILGNRTDLLIGRAAECDIRYVNTYVGKHHASLYISDTQITVTDNESLNRTFVNGAAVRQAVLKPGDVIYMMGMQIIVTRRFLYINNPDEKVVVQSQRLKQHHAAPYSIPTTEPDDTEGFGEFDYYYRAPRFKHDVEPFTLRLDAPPSGQTGDNMPMIMSIGPSVTMGMASATTAAFSVVNAVSSGDIGTAIPSIVMSLGMLSGTLLWPTITKSYQKKLAEQKEVARQSTYNSYLKQMEQRISKEIANQEKILRENDGTSTDYLQKVSAQPPQIWDRTPKHTDFLRIRLGSGRLPLQANIQYPERKFSVEQDNLMESMYQFGEKERWLNHVPVCLSLTERFISGIYASRSQLMTYAKMLILQLAALHSYDEVKLVVLYDSSDEEELSFVRWLPHTMDNDRRIRYIATTPEEAKNLSADLDAIIEHRKALSADQLADEAPYFVVLCLNKKLASKTECLRAVMEHKENLRFSLVSMYERLKDLPKECSAVTGIDDRGNGTLTLLNDVCDPPIPFYSDAPGHLDMQAVTQVLANTVLDVSNSAFHLPRKYTFMEMLDVGMVEHLNLVENWSVNDPTKSLAAPIGIDQYGDSFVLDLHERAHGPHGLIAGMTGSGKSETIISYILSMAIHYHPSEVAFILIDYKGGGMAKAFESIPHTAGIITNLDGNEINRSLVSMRSELHRRERIFRDVSKQHGISNIDIYKYQKLYRQGKVSEPLPHLIIISDEFAELKKDQPDFMAALTSTARVGRSLGVHLVLATQKPGGVVDDQIRSNSRFRLCLKVQDRGDSTEMMGRPEAAYLVETGRFYLQVGNNELFEMGQSAWAGASYHPAPKAIQELDDSVVVIDTNGRTLAEVNTDRYANKKDAPKQLDVITDYIRKVSEDEHIRPWKMWLDPIPAQIYVDWLLEKYPPAQQGGYTLNPVVGEYDDPIHQAQGIMHVPLSTGGNVIVYGSTGSGKGMFLETMCYSLITEHNPDEVNLYILDFGAETMTAFSEAPHVGDVILAHETEKVENLFKFLHKKIQTRKKLLSQYGGSLVQYNAQAAIKEPNIVVAINNFANFTELYDERQGDLAYLTREGIRYGIYFVLSCAGINNVRLNLQQNFKNIYCLQMNNSADYSVVVGKTGGLVPGKYKGRGLFRFDKDSVLEFQTASITQEASSYKFFQTFSAELAGRYAGKNAAAIPVLPERVSLRFLSRYVDPTDISTVPIGVEKDTLDIARVNLTDRPVHVVLSQNQEWGNFTDRLAEMLASNYNGDVILFSPDSKRGTVSQSDQLRVCVDPNACVTAVSDIFAQLLERNRAYKTAQMNKTPMPEFEPLFVVIQSVSQLFTILEGTNVAAKAADDDSPQNRLSLGLEKCACAYQIYFILADSEQKMRSLSGQAWFKSQISKSDFLWLGNGIDSQYSWTVNKKPQGANTTLSKSFGFVVTNAEATLVKFLQEQED